MECARDRAGVGAVQKASVDGWLCDKVGGGGFQAERVTRDRCVA